MVKLIRRISKKTQVHCGKLKIGKTISTKDPDVKDLYHVLYSLKDDEKARKTFLKKPGTSRHDLTMLNSKLAAAASEEGYQDYLENHQILHAKNFFQLEFYQNLYQK